VDANGVTKKVAGTQRAAGVVNDHRYCYGGKFCMHTTAALYGLHFLCYRTVHDRHGRVLGQARGKTLSESLAAVVGMPIFQFLIDVNSLAATVAYFNPISVADCVDILKGVGKEGGPVYRRELLRLLEVVGKHTGASQFRLDAILHGPPHGDSPVVYGNSAVPHDRVGVPNAAASDAGESHDEGGAMDTTDDHPDGGAGGPSTSVAGGAGDAPGDAAGDVADDAAADAEAPSAKRSKNDKGKRFDRRNGNRTRSIAGAQDNRVTRNCACPDPSCRIRFDGEEDPSGIDGPSSVCTLTAAKERLVWPPTSFWASGTFE
jgi:hypothetical protein